MEICQEGIDGVFPSWCVPVDLSIDTLIQLMIELALLGFIFAGVFAYGKWKRKKQREKRLNTSKASKIYESERDVSE
jgi:high-affinity Fe2+/Pb2+ permease|tara:strand:- start:10912 stop:11142 length:231 start_codon:yes stop_codon:yes gene_type:complete